MAMNHALIGEVAGVLAIIQVIPYIKSIFDGHTKPERTTYLIWFIVDAVTISSYIAVGARTTIWTGLVYTFTGMLIFGLSIKRGVGGFSKFDIGCFGLAILGVVLWATTKDALLALYYSTIVSKIGYLPTIKKAYFYPETENTLSWVMTAITGMLNLFALTTLQFSIALPPISGAITPTIVAGLLLFPQAHAKLSRHHHFRRIHLLLDHPVFAK